MMITRQTIEASVAYCHGLAHEQAVAAAEELTGAGNERLFISWAPDAYGESGAQADYLERQVTRLAPLYAREAGRLLIAPALLEGYAEAGVGIWLRPTRTLIDQTARLPAQPRRQPMFKSERLG